MNNSYQINWQPEIGDPTALGWLTVILYFMTAHSVWRFILLGGHNGQFNIPGRKVFWYGLLGLLILLGFNKQLDLQSLATELAKSYAHEYGWYKDRRIFQTFFIYGLFVFAGLAVLYVVFRFRALFRLDYLTLAGVFALTIFVLIRATSIHHMDHLISLRYSGISVNFILEVSGLLLILIDSTRKRKSLEHRNKLPQRGQK